MSDPLRFAVIGAGDFARFAVAQFVRHPAVQLVGAYDSDPAAVAALQQAHPEAAAFATLDGLLADRSIALVYIATPPALHYQHSLAALEAGKHVICEKPAALRLQQARHLNCLAEEKSLLFVVNLMQRYNVLFAAVQQLIASGVLGACLHGFFENYAADQFLPADHWFWDREQSGGNFIEHGVHFFDLFAGWLGQGQVVAAQTLHRPGQPALVDIAQCSVVYADHIPVHFYHGFNQPKVLDRQELRLQFERGEITLHEWVPTRLVLNAICTSEQVAQLQRLFPGAALHCHGDATPQTVQGRGKPITYQHQVRLDTGQFQAKSQAYQGLLVRMFDDQLKWIGERAWRRQVDARNAVDSVAMAAQADQIALSIGAGA